MSEFTHAALISGSIFLVVMFSTFGRRAYEARHALRRPLIMIAIVGWIYLRAMPLDNHAELTAYAVAVVLGLVFGAGATFATRLERQDDGKIFTVTGAAFVTVWVVAVVARLGFVWAVENVQWAHDQFGQFMITHQISLDVVAPFFVIWAVTMVLARLAVVTGRVNALKATPAPQFA